MTRVQPQAKIWLEDKNHVNWKILKQTKKRIFKLEKEFEQTQDITLIPRIELYEKSKQNVLKQAYKKKKFLNKQRRSIKGRTPHNPITIADQETEGRTFLNPITLE